MHNPFIDYRTGEQLRDLKHWKSLADTLWEYVNHKESKFEGDVGILERKNIVVDGVIYIGKETENIEETGILDILNYTVYQNEKELKNRILKITPQQARLMELNPETLRQIKKRIENKKPFRLTKKILYKLTFLF